MAEVYETDWLSSAPLFYHEQTGQVSRNINDVIDWSNLELDAEGFNLYLQFGYSVLGLTPVRHVRFLPPCSRLTRQDDGSFFIEQLPDPAVDRIDRNVSEAAIWEMFEAAVQGWEHRVQGEIVIPTSGGFDSRLLNFFMADKSRIRSFTYGLSRPQSASYEVVYAHRLSELLGTRWEQVELGGFHQHLDQWDQLYGVSTHAHGMYHIEFYDQVRLRLGGGSPLLSGIIGDAWAGGKPVPLPKRAEELAWLGLSHGMSADVTQSLFPAKNDLLQAFYEGHTQELADPRYAMVQAMRFKMMLLSYLLRVPAAQGYQPWSPFLDPDLALAMLNLPGERRRGRRWQVEFLHRHGIYLEGLGLKADTSNSLNRQAMEIHPLPPLTVSILREVIRPEYIDWINRTLQLMPSDEGLISRLLDVPKVGGLLRRAGVKAKRPLREAYSAYLTLRPIERLLRRRMAV